MRFLITAGFGALGREQAMTTTGGDSDTDMRRRLTSESLRH